MEDFYDELDRNRDAVRALLLAPGDPTAADAVAEACGHFTEPHRSLTALAEQWSSRSDGMSPTFTDALASRLIGNADVVHHLRLVVRPPGEPAVAKAQVIDTVAAMVIPGLSGARET